MKSILISGSSSGIGYQLADKLLALNFNVIGLSRQTPVFAINPQNYQHYSMDFADLTTLESKLRNIKTKHQLNTIICCAGYGQFGELEQFSLPQMQKIMDVNFLSQALLIKTFLPQLKQHNAGKIIAIGSESALKGERKASMYCASKFALRGLLQSLRAECRQANIGVTLINPGLVRTPFFDKLNFTPDEADIHALAIEDVVAAIVLVLQTPTSCVFEEINVQPILPKVKKKQY